MGSMICHRDAECRLFYLRVEIFPAEQPVKTRQHRRQLLQETLPFRRGFIPGWAADQQIVVEHLPEPLQSAANGRLAQEQPGCGAGDVSFLREGGKDDERVEVGLPNMRYAYGEYRYYALDLFPREAHSDIVTGSWGPAADERRNGLWRKQRS